MTGDRVAGHRDQVPAELRMDRPGPPPRPGQGLGRGSSGGALRSRAHAITASLLSQLDHPGCRDLIHQVISQPDQGILGAHDPRP